MKNKQNRLPQQTYHLLWQTHLPFRRFSPPTTPHIAFHDTYRLPWHHICHSRHHICLLWHISAFHEHICILWHGFTFYSIYPLSKAHIRLLRQTHLPLTTHLCLLWHTFSLKRHKTNEPLTAQWQNMTW